MTLNLSIVELTVLFFCAVTLGVVIHFFIVSRRNLKGTPVEKERTKKNVDDWKLKYFNEVEVKEKELSEFRSRLSTAEENNQIYEIEIEELQKQLHKRPEPADKPAHTGYKPNYLEELRMTQESLLEHNEKINQLLENIEVIKEIEERQKLMEEEKEILAEQVKELKYLLSQKETEIHTIKEKENITREMTSLLDNAYSEFNTLQSKMQKLETQVSSGRMINLEFEDMKEAYYKTTHDYDEQKLKLQAITVENQQMSLQLNDAEDKLREVSFLRQQLQKRVSYLEELNNDLQIVADANKKLEHQLRRMGELESMLNVVSEERDHLLKRQDNP